MKDEFVISGNFDTVTFSKFKWNAFLGPIGCGKTTFLKKITSSMSFDFFPQEKVIYLSDKESYPQDKMMERLLMDLDHQDMVKEVLSLFGVKEISSFLDHIHSRGMEQVLVFLYRYMEDPTVFILDEALSMVDHFHKHALLEWLKKDAKKKKRTIIYVSLDPEDLMYADIVMLWYQNKVFLTGTRKKVLKEDELFRRLGLEMPFVMELYHKLKYYEVVDHPVDTIEKMVDELWK